jgi:hypothetical protein
MTQPPGKYRTWVFILIIISTVIRGLLAALLELGNDEVYYRLYALFPDWSHFDHPSMVGITMQLFSLNMLLQSEFFLRFGAIVFGAINIWIVFLIGKKVKNERTGFISAVLYVSSIYASVITGIFILPDTPQSLFWIMSVYLILHTFSESSTRPDTNRNLILLGLTLGFGILSKYTTVFIWIGIVLFVLLFDRKWLKVKTLYLSFALTVFLSLPILIWNIRNDFISFTFHSSRVDMAGYGINLNYFLRELMGEFLYNNPVNFVLIILALITILKNKLQMRKVLQKLLILISLPLIMSFIIFSFFRETLPHWSAPAYTSLIFIAAAWLDQKRHAVAKPVLISSISVITIVVLLGYLQINHGVIQFTEPEAYNRMGKNDPSLDMFGYRQIGETFGDIVRRDINNGEMPEGSVLVGDNWFPLANYDYYAAYPADMKVFGLADLDHLHKYAWVNEIQGGFQKGMSGYYISDSKYFRPPNQLFIDTFREIEAIDTIQVYRGDKVVKLAFIWRLKDLKKVPADPFGRGE